MTRSTSTPRSRGKATIDVRLLGPLEAAIGGRAAALGGPKPRALLALLALSAGRVVSVDRLVEDLWPGAVPETATHAVQVYVSQLRKELGDVISRRGPGYVLEIDPDGVDVHRFPRLVHEGHDELRAGRHAIAADGLREALALWRGPALVDFEYEPFAQADIARLDELRFGALEDRIEADLSLGRHAELVPEIEALVEAQPLRERPRGLLMRALYLAGRQADALAAYRVARGTLVEELGIEPGPELRELEAAILRQDASLAPRSPSVVPAIRTRRVAAVLSIALEDSPGADLEVEEHTLKQTAATITAAAARHGGTAEWLADGSFVAVFGVPLAHEDDPLRAARAAIEVRNALVRPGSAALFAAIDLGEVVAADRNVSGPPIRSAARLRLRANENEILVSRGVARRIGHAARMEARGDAAALVELAATAPAFERRFDTPLVGRSLELRALRQSLEQAKRTASARATLIVGAPGVGKSRLAQELARRSRGAKTLSGRCLSYGDGITYWPLREMLGQASASTERDAVLAALDADTPPPATEIALLFRRLCEAIARERPLILVFDDVHWAEQTLLELVDGVVARGEGPMLVVCLARDELLEDRPDFLAARENVEQVVLDGLSGEEMEKLLVDLDGSILEPEQRARLVATAEGNPFFLEQLVALAVEGGLVERPLPETVRALLSNRLDRLGPGERAVLERGAVVGKEFTFDDVVSLLEPHAVPTVSAHLDTMSVRGFVRPLGGGRHAFRHGLLQEAVYRTVPKRLRAELHERFADRLDAAYSDLPDLDEFVGYHLEQAYELRTELGESDRRTNGLADEAGRRLGEAGLRAERRGDIPASIRLLRRATARPLPGMPLRGELLCDLGITLHASGAHDEACAALEQAIEDSIAAGVRKVELQARMELEYARLPRTQGATADRLLDAVSTAMPVLEAAEDHRWLGRALLLAGWVYGGRHGRFQARLDAAERALGHYEKSTWPVSTCVGEIANALYYGPSPAAEGIERLRQLLREPLGKYGHANLNVFLGGLVAQQGDFECARELIASASAAFDELGHRLSAATTSAPVRADIELLQGDLPAAEETLRWLCGELEQQQALSRLASATGPLAEALYRQGDYDEAAAWVGIGESHSAADDLDARILWMPVKAKLAARRGDHESAVELATGAVDLAGSSDALNRRANVHVDLAEVLRLAGREPEAARALEVALSLFDAKGNAVGASRVRELLGERSRS